jgi:hypothetical protein
MDENCMSQELSEYSPNARRILDEIMIFLFAPEATMGKGIALDEVSTFIGQFSKAAKSEVTTVKCLLSNFSSELEALERQIELREIEESEYLFKARLKAQEEQLRMWEFTRAERLRCEAQEKLRKWLVTDQETILRKIKSKELLTLSDFQKSRGVSKRSVNTAVAWGRIFSITGPDGLDYYPAFFADSRDYIRQCLAKVCQVLGDIPAFAKYQFLTTDSHWLVNGGSPIQAIRSGRVDEVLRATKWLTD